MHKYFPYLVSLGLVLSSMYIGNGYTPICAMVCLLPCALSFTSILGYLILCVAHYAIQWVFSGMSLSAVLFQIVMLLLSDLCLLSLPSVRKRTHHSGVFSELGCTLFLCLYYWWSSNSVCFIQMSGLVPSWRAYDLSFSGYLTCLAAGRSFLVNSLISCLPVTFLLSSIKSLCEVSVESVSFSR